MTPPYPMEPRIEPRDKAIARAAFAAGVRNGGDSGDPRWDMAETTAASRVAREIWIGVEIAFESWWKARHR